MTLAEAAKIAVNMKRPLRRVTVGDAVDALLLEVARSGKRETTKLWFEWKLAPMRRDLGERWLDEVSKADLRSWLATVTAKEAGRRHYAKAARRLWRWAAKRDEPWVLEDITEGLVTARPREIAVKFLTVDQCEQLLAGAGAYRPAVALGLFAGVRPEELAGAGKPPLTWAAVRHGEEFVRVPGEIAKTRAPRILEGLPPALWAWLPCGMPDDGRISPGRSRQIVRVARDVLGLDKWPVDALRHTFATYHVAGYNDPGKTSLLLGHEGTPALLHRHYRGLATQADARRFWALRPAQEKGEAHA